MEYLIKYYPKILTLFLEHVTITFLTISISLIIAFPISLYAANNKRIGDIFSKVFAILVPFTGLGMKTAVFALVMYTQFILIRNITKGLKEVPEEIIDAGTGMGLDKRELFFKIKLPLAMPVILAGIRIATISVISIATIRAWINAGVLGELIFEGLAQDYGVKIIIGTSLVAILSIGSNILITALERRYLERIK